MLTNMEFFYMQKFNWITLLIAIILSGITLNLGSSPQYNEDNIQNDPLGLSNSDSWSKIVKEGAWFNRYYCELFNDSIYVIGSLQLELNRDNYLYVSKYNSSGTKEWEILIEIGSYLDHIAYIFDNDSNISILYQTGYSKELFLIKLDSSGALLFSNEINLNLYGPYLVLGEDNSLIIFSIYSGKIFIMKYNKFGQFLWNNSFIIDSSYNYPSNVRVSRDKIYLSYKNNSLYYVAKFNGSGAIEWQQNIENEIKMFLLDANSDIVVVEEKDDSTAYLTKLNSSGIQIKTLLIEDYEWYSVMIWSFNDLLLYNENSKSVMCYDINLNLKWNYSSSHYLSFYWLFIIAQDSDDCVYIIQEGGSGYVHFVKINNTGGFLSEYRWGGGVVGQLRSLKIDLDNNLYLMCNCEHYNIWNNRIIYTVLVKNPLNGGIPPEPRTVLDERDYLLFSIIGVSCIISLIALISILRINKKRIS